MRAVFADTFYWAALTDPSDSLYQQAARIESEYAGRFIVTTHEVLSEFLTFSSGSNLRSRRRPVETVRALRRNPKIQILPQSRASFDAGFDLYESRPDKGYSLTDCISMQAMRDERLTDILTNDRHFGFRVLFRASWVGCWRSG